MSRWIKPRLAAYLSPAATLFTTEIASARLSGPCLLDVVVKIAAGDIFEHQVVPARVDPSIVDRHDVRVLERLGAAGLSQETLKQGRVLGQRARQEP